MKNKGGEVGKSGKNWAPVKGLFLHGQGVATGHA